MSNLVQFAYHYTARLGFGLVPIPHGMKKPVIEGWQNNPVTNPQNAKEIWARQMNMGLLHDVSRTCTVDTDNMEYLLIAAKVLNFDLLGLIESAPLKIKGKNGEKPLYRLPEDQELGFYKLVWPHETEKLDNGKPRQVCVIEFRTGPGKQDVLPPSIHPDTQQPYEWVGQPPRCYDDIPVMPPELLEFWLHLDEHMAAMKAACPWQQKPVVALSSPVRRFDTPFEGESAIEAVERHYSVYDLLQAEGYKARGQDRYLSPHSSTGEPGVVVDVSQDGKRRARTFHESDTWADGRWHDAFDLYCIFRYGGDFKAAIEGARQEFNLSRPALPAKSQPTPSLSQAIELWNQQGSEVLGEAGEYLEGLNIHHKAREALVNLVAYIYSAAGEGQLQGKEGSTFSLAVGNLRQFAALVGGHHCDMKPRLEWLADNGLIDSVRKVEPNNPRSGWVIDLPACPQDLRFRSFKPSPLALERPQTLAVRDSKNKANGTLSSPKEKTQSLAYGRVRINSENTKNPLRALLRMVLCIGRNKNIGLKSISQKLGMRLDTVRRKFAELQELGYLDVGGNLTCTVDQFFQDMRACGAEGARKRLINTLERQRDYAAWQLSQICFGEVPAKEKTRFLNMRKRCEDQLQRLYDGEAPHAVIGRVA